jgi:predicted nucleic acid-binding protein
MAVLIDSDINIEVTRWWNGVVIAQWHQLLESEDTAVCSPVTVAELWHGAKRGEHAALEELFTALICVPIDQHIGHIAGDYLRKYARSHSLELGDALIAATATIHDAALWTRNRKHYPMAGVRFY